MSDPGDPAIARLLAAVERLAGGDLDEPIALSERHDQLDALAHGINVLVDELRFATRSARNAMETAERANRAKTEFLRTMSHEIRTPVAAIMSLVAILGDPNTAARERQELAGRALSNGKQLVALIDDILDLSKVEAEILQVEAEPVSLRQIFAEVVASLGPSAAERGLRLVERVADEVPAFIESDARRVRQILLNLTGNALKFTERGEVRLSAGLVANGRAQLCIDVADSGIGIEPVEQLRLFAPFAQADPTIERRFGGSGLGLALSRGLAERLGGSLTLVSSSPHLGSTFRLILPSKIVAGVEPQRSASPQGLVQTRPLAGVRILLAEDNPDIRLSFSSILELAGATVDGVDDGPQAVELATTREFDVVVMDVWMPSLDGLESTRRIRNAGRTVPILALTADAMKEQRAECLSAGCDDYLSKPIDHEHLIEKILTYVRPRV